MLLNTICCKTSDDRSNCKRLDGVFGCRELQCGCGYFWIQFLKYKCKENIIGFEHHCYLTFQNKNEPLNFVQLLDHELLLKKLNVFKHQFSLVFQCKRQTHNFWHLFFWRTCNHKWIKLQLLIITFALLLKKGSAPRKRSFHFIQNATFTFALLQNLQYNKTKLLFISIEPFNVCFTK